ncbi:MAG: TIGR02147 family protein [Chitinispirillaceae bacterium]|nr:TIGR02147 family protein [Chitinispirillaceae bacterium]
MKSILTYSNYKKYILDFIEEKRSKNKSYSYRSAARQIGIPSGTLSRILNGTRRIGIELLPKFTKYLGLKRREEEYFKLLIAFDSIKNAKEKLECYKKILKIRAENYVVVPPEKHRLFEQWYNVALLELLRIVKEGEPDFLSSLFIPKVSATKIRKALKLLEELGYVKHELQKGTYPTEPFLTSGDKWESVAIQAFQMAVSELAVKVLDTIPREERDFSTLTMALSPEAFEKVREVLKKVRTEIAEIERNCLNPDRVYQINFQFFPLTLKPNTKKGVDNND